MHRSRGSTAGATKSAKKIASDTLDAAQLQSQAVAIAVRSGSATQSDYVAALLNVERLRDAVAAA